ncbi:Uncharacterized protein dnm_007260 [Desulfonema magnum]|uniref:Uncharacterized protein n=1 Tax=Desulfonema magnum TaxID=45655 RepID=A0A975BG35_9BACT|nr:Uncharacterized protein dnm_007260 [Desulfonema magnum]
MELSPLIRNSLKRIHNDSKRFNTIRKKVCEKNVLNFNTRSQALPGNA